MSCGNVLGNVVMTAQNATKMTDKTHVEVVDAVTHRALRSDATGGYRLACNPSRWVGEEPLVDDGRPVDCLLCLAAKEGGPRLASTGRRP